MIPIYYVYGWEEFEVNYKTAKKSTKGLKISNG